MNERTHITVHTEPPTFEMEPIPIKDMPVGSFGRSAIGNIYYRTYASAACLNRPGSSFSSACGVMDGVALFPDNVELALVYPNRTTPPQPATREEVPVTAATTPTTPTESNEVPRTAFAGLITVLEKAVVEIVRDNEEVDSLLSDMIDNSVQDAVDNCVEEKMDKKLEDLTIEADSINDLTREVENIVDGYKFEVENIENFGDEVGNCIREYLVNDEEGKKILDKAVKEALSRLLQNVVGRFVATSTAPTTPTEATPNPPVRFNGEGGIIPNGNNIQDLLGL